MDNASAYRAGDFGFVPWKKFLFKLDNTYLLRRLSTVYFKYWFYFNVNFKIKYHLTVYYPKNMVAWPSGLRRWFKAPVSSEAWVRIPPLPKISFPFCFFSSSNGLFWYARQEKMYLSSLVQEAISGSVV